MKIERDDIAIEAYTAIAESIIERLKPLITQGLSSREDTVYDKKALASYLRVSESTISKLVMNKEIPYFKVQAGQSGGVRFRQRDIDKWIQKQSIPDLNPLSDKLRP